jgi:hypothetical protein
MAGIQFTNLAQWDGEFVLYLTACMDDFQQQGIQEWKKKMQTSSNDASKDKQPQKGLPKVLPVRASLRPYRDRLEILPEVGEENPFQKRARLMKEQNEQNSKSSDK